MSHTPMSDASQTQTPSTHRSSAAQPQSSSSSLTTDGRNQSGSNPGPWTAESAMLSQSFSPRNTLHGNPSVNVHHHHHGFVPSPATTTPAYLTSPPGSTAALVAQRNKLLLQTTSLPQRRGSFGPNSAGTQSGPTTMSSQPATPQSATASLPGSPQVAAPEQPKTNRSSLPNGLGGSMGSLRKKRNAGSSSSLSTSVPLNHQFAMPQLPNFTPPLGSDISASGTTQPMHLNFGSSLPTSSGFADHRASMLSNSSGR